MVMITMMMKGMASLYLKLLDLLLQLSDEVLLTLEFGVEAADLAVLPASRTHYQCRETLTKHCDNKDLHNMLHTELQLDTL